MKLPLKEPSSARYLYISPDNTVHVFIPVVGGTSIGLDNTCKAVYALQEFFNKGSNSNKKVSLKNELLAYKEALESDLSLLGEDSELAKQKQERLNQMNAYLKALVSVEQHPELKCLESEFLSYPRSLENMMGDKNTSNLYSMVLRPIGQNSSLRSEATNPVFSVAHKSQARGLWENKPSRLQQKLIKAYSPLTLAPQDLKSQFTQQVAAQITSPPPVDFVKLRDILQKAVRYTLGVDVDFSKKDQNPLTQQDIDAIMAYEPQTTEARDYIGALLNHCAPNLFDNQLESPFNTLTTTEGWSIATQFLLGITNIYGVSQRKITRETNFGSILDGNPDLSKSLAQTLAKAQMQNQGIETVCCSWMNAHATELGLKDKFTDEDLKAIQKYFALQYTQSFIAWDLILIMLGLFLHLQAGFLGWGFLVQYYEGRWLGARGGNLLGLGRSGCGARLI